MQLLCNYSLAEVATDTKSYAMHPFVHQWAYHYQKTLRYNIFEPLAIIIVGWATPEVTERDYMIIGRRFLPHEQRGLEIYMNEGSPPKVDHINRNTKAMSMAKIKALHHIDILFKEREKLDHAKQIFC